VFFSVWCKENHVIRTRLQCSYSTVYFELTVICWLHFATKNLVIGYLIAHVIYWVMHFQIIRPHHSTTYVDAAYCYRPSSVACWSVYHSYEPRKTAEPIEMPFGLWARLDSTNHVLDAVQIPVWKGAIFRGKGRPIIKYRDLPAWAVQKRLNWSRCCLGCWVSWTLQTTY